MLQHQPQSFPRRHSSRPPFAHIVCAVDEGDETAAAIEQAIAVAGDDSRVVFLASWYGAGSAERAVASEQRARQVVAGAVARARAAGVQAEHQLVHAPRLSEALLSRTAMHDLVVVGAPAHGRATGIVLGQAATLVVHHCTIPVLVARERPLSAGVVVATRARPADRAALTAGTHLAARLGSELTVLHTEADDDERRRPELHAELVNARALLGRDLDYVQPTGPAAQAIVEEAEVAAAGLVVLGSRRRRGVSAIASVSERVAHLAPCSVLIMR